MNYLHSQGFLNKGDVVKVELDKEANIILLDSINYNNYVNSRQFTYYGGFAAVFPYQITVPYSGVWHIVMDLGGIEGAIKPKISVIKNQK